MTELPPLCHGKVYYHRIMLAISFIVKFLRVTHVSPYSKHPAIAYIANSLVDVLQLLDRAAANSGHPKLRLMYARDAHARLVSSFSKSQALGYFQLPIYIIEQMDECINETMICEALIILDESIASDEAHGEGLPTIDSS